MKDYLGEQKSFLNKLKVERSHFRAMLYTGAIALAAWFIVLPECEQSDVKIKTMRVVIM